MLPVVDKPLIQYAVEEAVAAGITEMIFITGRNKRSIADHFDKAYELEHELEKRNKTKLLHIAQNIVPKGVSCTYIRQNEALGLGHAVLTAAHLIGDEPFAVILGRRPDPRRERRRASRWSSTTSFTKAQWYRGAKGPGPRDFRLWRYQWPASG